jgi:pyruvate/2-oxoglutarate dehydrogenase complex dihydrolipoamide dehydrogenase (E3) component
MDAPARFEALILGSGAGGKLLAWHLGQSGRRTAVVERQWIGGSCPNVNLHARQERDLECECRARGAPRGGVRHEDRAWTIDMVKVRQRKRDMVDGQIAAHLRNYKDGGAPS